MLSAEEAMLEA